MEKTKVAVSKLLGVVQDKCVENLLRDIIFSSNNKIDWVEVETLIEKNMPEMRK